MGFSFISGPEGSRTPNLLIRSQMLYPVKLRVLLWAAKIGICMLPAKLGFSEDKNGRLSAKWNVSTHGKKYSLKTALTQP